MMRVADDSNTQETTKPLSLRHKEASSNITHKTSNNEQYTVRVTNEMQKGYGRQHI